MSVNLPVAFPSPCYRSYEPKFLNSPCDGTLKPSEAILYLSRESKTTHPNILKIIGYYRPTQAPQNNLKRVHIGLLKDKHICTINYF